MHTFALHIAITFVNELIHIYSLIDTYVLTHLQLRISTFRNASMHENLSIHTLLNLCTHTHLGLMHLPSLLHKYKRKITHLHVFMHNHKYTNTHTHTHTHTQSYKKSTQCAHQFRLTHITYT